MKRKRGRPTLAARAGFATREERLAQIEQLLVSGVTLAQLCKLMAEEHDITEGVVRADVKLLRARWTAEGTDQPRLMLMNAYRKAISHGKLAPAIRAMALIVDSTPTEENRRSVARYKRLGNPPADPIAAVNWAQRALILGLQEVMTDERLPAARRQTAMLRFGRGIAALTPYAEIYDALRRLRQDAEELDEDDDGPQVIDVTPGGPPRLRPPNDPDG